MQYPNSIPIALGECVTGLNTKILADLQGYDSNIETVQYMYGNWKEIGKKMKEYTDSPTLRTQKFPVVILIEDVIIDQRSTDFFGIADLNIVIANATEPKYSSDEREPLFENVLRPIYYELCKQIARHEAFAVGNPKNIRGRYAERKFWGMDNNTVNALGDYIDAIELFDLRLPLNWQWCNQTINANI
jgi:hypothetical protein